uniref:Uncharacterized protein n=1 Tax=Lotharella globosa TaxID=91324 RepID=A0A7S3ZFN9_9EUKA|mmetsp:Transcript_20027/g.38620  ORF Transcript_20027/g.38620 Transcript_20027/m.38620 type:complete len:205 (-) Transcript_20027:813-1427(-)
MADSTRAKGDLSNLQGERSRKLALDFKDVYAAKEASPELKNQIDALRRDGFLVLRNVLSRGSLDEIRQALGPYIREGKKANLGRNNFEGHKTNRVYALLAKSRAFDQIAENKRVLDIMDRVLMPNYLLSACLAIDIHPGETPQVSDPNSYNDNNNNNNNSIIITCMAVCEWLRDFFVFFVYVFFVVPDIFCFTFLFFLCLWFPL